MRHAKRSETIFVRVRGQGSAVDRQWTALCARRRSRWRAPMGRTMRDSMRVFLSVAAIALIGTQSPSAQEPLTLVRSIDLPRVEGRIDHLAFDAAGQRLFVAALGNNTVEVLDVKSGNHIKSLPGFREPQGIAVLPDAKLVAVANGQGEGLQFLNVDDYRLGQMIRLGEDSDNVRYDA